MDASTRISERVDSLRKTFAAHQLLVDDSARILQNTTTQLNTVCKNYDPVRQQAGTLDRTLRHVESTKVSLKRILDDLKVSHQLEGFIQTTNHDAQLDSVLETMNRVSKATTFFVENRELEISEGAVRQGRLTLEEAYHKCGMLLNRMLKNSIRVPSVAELEVILGKPLAERPQAMDVYMGSDLPTLEAMYKLIKSMRNAKRTECVTIYADARKAALQSMMRSMGLQADQNTAVLTSSAAPERLVTEWVKAMRALAQAVEWEQQLAKQLFGSHSEKVLIMVSREAIDSMVTTGVQLGGGRQFAEKLFPVLDMIGCLRSPELSPLLTKSDEISAPLNRLLGSLRQAARALADIFLAAVANDVSVLPKDLTAATTVAPQTAFAMRFLKHLYNVDVAAQLTFVDPSLQLASRTLKHLEQNLTAKVNASIKERPAAALALLNNSNYVHKGVAAHENLRRSLGASWDASHSATLQQTRAEYMAQSWEPLLGVIQAACRESSATIKKDTVKDYFKKVNARIEKTHAAQALWSIPDATLKTHLRAEIAGTLMPAYNQFWRMYLGLSQLRNPGKHFKYDSIELEDMIQTDLFGGKRPRARPSLEANARLLQHV